MANNMKMQRELAVAKQGPLPRITSHQYFKQSDEELEKAEFKVDDDDENHAYNDDDSDDKDIVTLSNTTYMYLDS